jgi:uncharacterized membrane protein
MRKAAVMLGFVLATGGMLSTSSAHAATWAICNRSAYNVDVAIAYGVPNGYTSEGWWTVRACGGCAVVFSGNLAASGVFLRGENTNGAVYGGSNLFCTRQSAFTMAHANVDRAECTRRGGKTVSFQMHTIRSNRTRLTTTLNNPRGSSRVCID